MLLAQKTLKEMRAAKSETCNVEEEDSDVDIMRNALGTERPRISVLVLDPNMVIEPPAEMARRLACSTGAALDKQQYEMIVMCVWPLQYVWDFAVRCNRLSEWGTEEARLRLVGDANIPPVRIFGHGAGGSGKTYCLTRVILPLYEYYMPGQSRSQASQNSAARLIKGETMHARAGLKQNSIFSNDEPSRRVKEKLKACWKTVNIMTKLAQLRLLSMQLVHVERSGASELLV